MTLAPNEYDALVNACNTYKQLMNKYRRLTQMRGQLGAVIQLVNNQSDVSRIKWCVKQFETYIGDDWHER